MPFLAQTAGTAAEPVAVTQLPAWQYVGQLPCPHRSTQLLPRQRWFAEQAPPQPPVVLLLDEELVLLLELVAVLPVVPVPPVLEAVVVEELVELLVELLVLVVELLLDDVLLVLEAVLPVLLLREPVEPLLLPRLPEETLPEVSAPVPELTLAPPSRRPVAGGLLLSVGPQATSGASTPRGARVRVRRVDMPGTITAGRANRFARPRPAPDARQALGWLFRYTS